MLDRRPGFVQTILVTESWSVLRSVLNDLVPSTPSLPGYLWSMEAADMEEGVKEIDIKTITTVMQPFTTVGLTGHACTLHLPHGCVGIRNYRIDCHDKKRRRIMLLPLVIIIVVIIIIITAL